MKGAAAALLAVGVFFVYRATLLPDFDFGDTASFQTMGGLTDITPRDGYPLYFALAHLIVPFFESRAYAMNLLSAIQAALACGVLVLVAAELSGSLVAAVASALVFAASYTFWSQAVIAEVYSLHLLLVGLTLLLLLRWADAPTWGRLTAFFAVYALGFGNHLSMVLLLPAFTIFLLISSPGGWRSLMTPRVIATAAAIAALGALQYVWNLSAIWYDETSTTTMEAFRNFWFDATKSDWRETMILEIPIAAAGARAAMYRFDLLQQFGPIPPLLALAGLISLFRTNWRRGTLLLLMFVATLAFALGYNVGDAYVFLLPSHYLVALACAVGIAVVQRLAPVRVQTAAGLAVLVLGLWNMYDNYPALDRSQDRRPSQFVTALTDSLIERNALLLTDLNWQQQNGLTYYGQHVRPEVLHTWLADVFIYAPALVRDSAAIGRRVFVTERGVRHIEAAYGPVFRVAANQEVPTIRGVVDALPPGTRYVLCLLRPAPEFTIDQASLTAMVGTLTGNRAGAVESADYTVVAGRVGRAPDLVHSAKRPFRTRVTIDQLPVEIRMESWLEFDTIRRMGFGHVIANRHHALIMERGVSFVALDEDGRALRTAYAGGIYEPQPRYEVLSSY